MKLLIFLFLILSNFAQAQINLADQLSAHVYFLSDDRLEGRATGSPGEQIALDYISSYFKEYGLAPQGTKGFVQSFDFKLGKKTKVTVLRGNELIELDILF